MKTFDEMTGPERWAYLTEQLPEDAASGWAKAVARHLSLAAGGRTSVFVRLALALARDGITYETDRDRIGAQAFESPEKTWTRGIGACHQKARMVCAILNAGGVPARLVAVWAPGQTPEDPPTLPHVFAECEIHGAWIPLEPTAARARFGERLSDVPKEANGKWKL